MEGDWVTKRLGDVCLKITDGSHQSPKSVESGKPMASVKDLKSYGINLDSARLISEEDFSNLVKQGCQPELGDVLIAKDGNTALDTVCNFEKEADVVLLSSVAILRPDPEQIIPRYLKYYFCSNRTMAYLKNNFISGAAIPRVILKDFKKAEIYLPNLVEQKAIVHTLGSLDDKIELNRQMNITLGSMTQALFKSWFVDFDPVIDNALAKSNPIPQVFADRAEQRREISENPELLSRNGGVLLSDIEKNYQSLFPNEFEFTEEMGWIPKGWQIGQLSDHALIEMGQSPKGDTYNSCSDGMPLVNGPVEFGTYFTNRSKWTTSPTKVAQKGDLVVCVRGSTTGRFVKSDGQYCLGRGVCSIRAKHSQCFVDHLFKLSIDQLLVLATGSIFPNWSRKTLTDYTVIIPPLPIIDIFDGFVSPKIDRIESGFIESSSLAKIRDALLPKLLSGELRIPGAEKLIDEIKA